MTQALLMLALVAAGGALGGIGRHFVSGVVARAAGERFPWGTLAVNLSGAAAAGALAAALLATEGHVPLRPGLWLALLTGCLGSYTTVSSFALQTLALVRAGEPARAALNVVASTGGAISVASGAYLAAAALLGR